MPSTAAHPCTCADACQPSRRVADFNFGIPVLIVRLVFGAQLGGGRLAQLDGFCQWAMALGLPLLCLAANTRLDAQELRRGQLSMLGIWGLLGVGYVYLPGF